MTAVVLRRGALSWQQESFLLQRSRHGSTVVPGEVVSATVGVSSEVGEDELVRRLHRLAEREVSLQAVEHDERGVTYAENLPLPITFARCATAADAAALIARSKKWECAPTRGPRWRAVVVSHPGEEGGPVRSVLLQVDHLVTDRHSLDLLCRELSTGEPHQGVGRSL